MLQELLSTIQAIQIKHGEEDYCVWKHNPKGKYTVASAYNFINQTQDNGFDTHYRLIWDNNLPMKISAFAWKALQNKIPTKENLQKRGMIEENIETKCIFCGEQTESSTHILFSCPITWKLWCLCYDWWGIRTAAQEDGWNHLKQHQGLINKGRTRKIWSTIWFFTVWTIWLWRNSLIFKKERLNLEQVFGLIKFCSFVWIKAKWIPDLPQTIWYNDPMEASKGYFK
ncbi:hypothetical protein SLA2020_220710 [Shorea laevis]